jgi:hypothetical protein
MPYESEGVKPISRRIARQLLNDAGLPDAPIPRIGYLVPLDDCMQRWISNESGRLVLVTWSKLLKPAWVGLPCR